MDITVTVRGIKHSALHESKSIKNYVYDHLDKMVELLSHLKEPVHVVITVDVANPHPHHIFDLRIHAPKFEVIVKREDPELYKTIDEGIDIAIRKLTEHKKEQIGLHKKSDFHR